MLKIFSRDCRFIIMHHETGWSAQGRSIFIGLIFGKLGREHSTVGKITVRHSRQHRLWLALALPAPRRAAGRGRLLAALAARLQGDPAGAAFFFRLSAPHKAIAGYGCFARCERVSRWLAWESFGDMNGTDTFAVMTAPIEVIAAAPGASSSLVPRTTRSAAS